MGSPQPRSNIVLGDKGAIRSLHDLLCSDFFFSVLNIAQARSQTLLHMELFGLDSIVIRLKKHHNYPCPLGTIKSCTALWKFRFP